MKRCEESYFVDACEALTYGQYGDALDNICHCIAMRPERVDYHVVLLEIAYQYRQAGGSIPTARVEAMASRCSLIAPEIEWLQSRSDEASVSNLIDKIECLEKARPDLNFAMLRQWVNYLMLAEQQSRTGT